MQPLRVASVERLTREAIAVTFDVPADLRERYAFAPGQFLALEARIDGEPVRRSYSICSTPQAPQLRVAIKRVANGTFSSWAHEALRPGETLDVAPPDGRFGRALIDAPRDERPRHYLAFAAGSGITPIVAIVAHVLATDPHASVTLVYGNRGSASVMFREELQALKDRYLARFAMLFVMSREPQEIDTFAGRIDRRKCDELFARWIDPQHVAGAFVCGPAGMRDDVVASMETHGIARERIAIERFAARAVDSGDERANDARAAREAGCEASATFDGRTFAYPVRPHDESLLDAGLRAGVELPYACKGGVCGTCRAMLVAGEVDMDVHYALEDYEIARGAILLCQSYPVTPTVAVDLDAAASG